jgi:hypothetical protein
MKKFQKIIIFTCLLSFIFSIVITDIEPKTVTFGETVSFVLTVQDYSSPVNFKLADQSFSCSAYDSETNTISCSYQKSDFNKFDFLNLKKTLFADEKPTNVSVTFKRPSKIVASNVAITNLYTNQITKFTFIVNDNELYNPNDNTARFKFQGESDSKSKLIINCTIDDEEIHNIYCYYKFDESLNGKIINFVYFGDSRNLISSPLTLNYPPDFLNIQSFLSRSAFYASSSQQDVYFQVNSAYKMNEHSIVLVPETSSNTNITLNSCTIYDYNIIYAKCSGKFDKSGLYNLYVDNNPVSGLKILVYPELPAIKSVSNIKPSELLISSLETTFTLEVDDYLVNLDKAVFSLVNYYNNNNKYYLTKCAKVEGTNNEITCVGTIKNVGLFFVYLNGKQQSSYVRVFSSSLSKAFNISPNITKFTNINFTSTSKEITIIFDTTNNFELKTISLKGTNNSFAALDFKGKSSYSLVYYATFPVNDTYYLYINNVIQNNVSITLTNENYTSEISSISPSLVAIDRRSEFTLTVDTNFGIENVGIYLIKKTYNSNINKMTCNADSSDSTKALCTCYLYDDGDYYVSLGNIDFQAVTVKAKSLPIELVGFSPYSIESSTEAQKVFLYFKDDASNYKDKIKFAGKEILTPTCELDSKYALICSATFTNDDKYAITIDDIYFNSFIYVNKEDNTYQEDVIDDDDTNIIDDSDSNVNYIKISSLLLLTLLIF